MMSESVIQVLAGTGLFFLGLLVGAFFHRSVQGETAKNKRLEQRISELEAEALRYQADVSEHFMQTAELVRTMNKSYQDVHNHLAQSASKLCGTDHSNDFLKVAFTGKDEQPDGSTIENGDEALSQQAPMDYAPKTDDEQGTLSESYGLKNDNLASDDALSNEPKLDDTKAEEDKNKA